MEQQIGSSLEQIQNPILVILLAGLMAAVVALWIRDQQNRRTIVEMLMENIGAIKDVNTRLSGIDERLESLEERLPSQ